MSSRWGSKPYCWILVGSKPSWVASLPGLVDGQQQAEGARGVVVPRYADARPSTPKCDCRWTNSDVIVAVLVRRLVDCDLVEHAALVVQLRRVDGEWQALL